MTITVSAPGKVHLTSAHIVVYGKPGLLCSINLRVYVSIKSQKNKLANARFLQANNGNITIKSNFLKTKLELKNEEILKYTQSAKERWLEYTKNNKIELIKSLTAPANFLQIIIGETLLHLKEKLQDVEIEIKSEVPVGANFGGSASVSAALVGALFAYFKKDLNKDEIYSIVYETEKRAHGNPSGGDPAVIIYGGLLWFRKETEFLKLFKPLNFLNFPQYLIINSGKPKEGTAEMVHLVRKLVNKRPKYAEKIMNQMEKLKKQYVLALNNNNTDELIKIAKRDVRLLAKLGVVSEKAMSIIRDLEQLGAGVSVSGAGGKKNGSGALIVLAKDYSSIKEYCQKKKLETFDVQFQTEGVRKEK